MLMLNISYFLSAQLHAVMQRPMYCISQTTFLADLQLPLKLGGAEGQLQGEELLAVLLAAPPQQKPGAARAPSLGGHTQRHPAAPALEVGGRGPGVGGQLLLSAQVQAVAAWSEV